MVTRCACNLTIMPFGKFRYIFHTALHNLHSVSVESFMQFLRLWKMYVDQSKKNFCNICGYCFVEWSVKPNNISRSMFCFLPLIFGLFEINFEPTYLKTKLEKWVSNLWKSKLWYYWQITIQPILKWFNNITDQSNCVLLSLTLNNFTRQ